MWTRISLHGSFAVGLGVAFLRSFAIFLYKIPVSKFTKHTRFVTFNWRYHVISTSSLIPELHHSKPKRVSSRVTPFGIWSSLSLDCCWIRDYLSYFYFGFFYSHFKSLPMLIYFESHSHDNVNILIFACSSSTICLVSCTPGWCGPVILSNKKDK